MSFRNVRKVDVLRIRLTARAIAVQTHVFVKTTAAGKNVLLINSRKNNVYSTLMQDGCGIQGKCSG